MSLAVSCANTRLRSGNAAIINERFPELLLWMFAGPQRRVSSFLLYARCHDGPRIHTIVTNRLYDGRTPILLRGEILPHGCFT